MTDRDHFAAALSVVRRIDLWLEEEQADDADQTLRDARSSLIALAAKLDYADAMLRERARSYEKSDEKIGVCNMKHDASPIVPSRATAGGVTPPPGSSGGTINRSAERQSPASECGGGEPLDVPQADNALAAGGRGHRTTTMSNLVTHDKSKCAGEFCCIHNPSPHHMREWPMRWRGDAGKMERICEHGVGHPDPDDAACWERLGQGYRNIHGCDGCCRDSRNESRNGSLEGRETVQ